MKKTIHIILFLAILYGCNNDTDNNKQSIKIETTPAVLDSIIDDSVKQKMNIDFSPGEFEVDPILNFKSIVRGMRNNRTTDSVVISNRDSIDLYPCITNMFNTQKLDSVEFFGPLRYYQNPRPNGRLGSVLILYFNDEKIAKQELSSLNLNYKKNFRATETMFKGGGIAFELDNQLCIYPISTCAPGIEGLLRIDSIISAKVFANKSFSRLHSSCGMGPFKLIKK
jgi:hypothetical protein